MSLQAILISFQLIFLTVFTAISGYAIISGDREAARKKKAKKAKALANKNLSGESKI